MEFDTVEQFKKVIKKIEALTDGLSVLGIYKNGKLNNTN
jgi:hypothetical protein